MNDPAATLALCSWLKKRVAEWESEAKSQMELEPGERKAAKLNGTVIAYTNMVKGRKSVKVLNEAMLLAFAEAYAPDEVETTVQIRPAYRTKLLDSVLKRGDLYGPDDVLWPDVVEVVTGDPYLTTKLEPDAGIAISGLLQQGRIGVDGLKAIEGES